MKEKHIDLACWCGAGDYPYKAMFHLNPWGEKMKVVCDHRDCWWKYADISKKTTKRKNGTAKYLPKSKHYWHYMSYWLDKEENLTKRNPQV